MNPAKTYTKKPVKVKAVQLHQDITVKEVIEIAQWCGGTLTNEGPSFGITIPTLEGEMFAGIGWYIVEGIQGEFYPVKEDIFNESYDED